MGAEDVTPQSASPPHSSSTKEQVPVAVSTRMQPNAKTGNELGAKTGTVPNIETKIAQPIKSDTPNPEPQNKPEVAMQQKENVQKRVEPVLSNPRENDSEKEQDRESRSVGNSSNAKTSQQNLSTDVSADEDQGV